VLTSAARRRSKPVRGKPTRPNARAAILAAARQLCFAHGADGVSARKIARAVGVSPTAIYLYYRNIDHLLEQLRLEGHALLAGYLRAAADRGSAVDRIRAMGRAYHRFGLEHPRYYALMFSLRAEKMPRAEALARESETLQLLGTEVRAGIAGAELRSDLDPLVTTNALWAQIHGVTALAVARLLAETAHGDEPAVVDAVLDAALAWIAVRRDACPS
jgi:AcrR family transcriptional regulator